MLSPSSIRLGAEVLSAELRPGMKWQGRDLPPQFRVVCRGSEGEVLCVNLPAEGQLPKVGSKLSVACRVVKREGAIPVVYGDAIG